MGGNLLAKNRRNTAPRTQVSAAKLREVLVLLQLPGQCSWWPHRLCNPHTSRMARRLQHIICTYLFVLDQQEQEQATYYTQGKIVNRQQCGVRFMKGEVSTKPRQRCATQQLTVCKGYKRNVQKLASCLLPRTATKVWRGLDSQQSSPSVTRLQGLTHFEFYEFVSVGEWMHKNQVAWRLCK